MLSPTGRCGVEPLLRLDGKPFDYPAPVVECNTFVCVQVGRPLSVDGFFEEQRAVSCPPSLTMEPDECSSDPLIHSRSMAKRGDASPSCSTATPAEFSISTASCGQSVAMYELRPQLELMLPGPLLGSPDLPSMGSAGHGKRECKPCSFVHTKGCDTGVDCQFCHLCEPGESKRRSKDKRQFFKVVRRAQRFAIDLA